MTTAGEFQHVTYGRRKDGTIGPAEEGNPVLESVEAVRPSGASAPTAWRQHWSDGTVDEQIPHDRTDEIADRA